MKHLFHIFVTLSLLYIGEYTTALFLQLVFLITLFKFKYLIYPLYAPVMFFVLAKLFASAIYIVYFINSTLFLYLLYRENLFLCIKKLAIFTFYLLFLNYLYLILDDQLYELYLDINIVDVVNSISSEVIYSLMILQIVMLYLIGIIKKKISRNYKCI